MSKIKYNLEVHFHIWKNWTVMKKSRLTKGRTTCFALRKACSLRMVLSLLALLFLLTHVHIQMIYAEFDACNYMSVHVLCIFA